jgi:SNF2 family DNA or RNA helicase
MQAEDRIHRIGQTADRCIIYYLVVKDTVDEGPLESLSKHYADIAAVMDGNKNAQFVDINESMIAKVKERKLLKNKKGVQIEYT